MAFEQNESGTESEVEKYKNMNFYERLGVTKDTPQDQIRKAYITQMRKFQAGLSSEPGTKEHEDTTAILQFINEAYETLKDVDKRSYYDVGGSSNRSGSRNRSYRHQEYQKETENARREQEEKQKAREKEEERLRQEMEDLKKRREQKERLEGFIEAAKQGPYVFKRYTKEQKVKGIEENFIVAPEVFKIIKEEAIRKAQFGARIYDNYVKEWVKDASLIEEL